MLYKCRKSIECSVSTNNIGQQRSSVTADIELLDYCWLPFQLVSN